jgi:hypothetical protein
MHIRVQSDAVDYSSGDDASSVAGLDVWFSDSALEVPRVQVAMSCSDVNSDVNSNANMVIVEEANGYDYSFVQTCSKNAMKGNNAPAFDDDSIVQTGSIESGKGVDFDDEEANGYDDSFVQTGSKKSMKGNYDSFVQTGSKMSKKSRISMNGYKVEQTISKKDDCFDCFGTPDPSLSVDDLKAEVIAAVVRIGLAEDVAHDLIAGAERIGKDFVKDRGKANAKKRGKAKGSCVMLPVAV